MTAFTIPAFYIYIGYGSYFLQYSTYFKQFLRLRKIIFNLSEAYGRAWSCSVRGVPICVLINMQIVALSSHDKYLYMLPIIS